MLNRLQQWISPPAHRLEDWIDHLRYGLRARAGAYRPISIVPYRGFGTPSHLYLKGRVLEDSGVTPSRVEDRLWDLLINMYRRMESDEVPGAVLTVRARGTEMRVQADEEGYFEVNIDFPTPSADLPMWEPVELELVTPRSRRQAQAPTARGLVLQPGKATRFGVISDVDDTIVRTEATRPVRMARNVFLSSARTRQAFPGVPAFYRALAGPDPNPNPLFFVSSSPWNLYDLLSEFFNLQGIPDPVLFLRDWGLSEHEFLPIDNVDHKVSLIRQILDTYPALSFILLGDSGQQDPEIYTRIAAQYPGRVLAIYIRDVNQDPQRTAEIHTLADAAESTDRAFILSADTAAFARHGGAQGWIGADDLAAVLRETGSDQ